MIHNTAQTTLQTELTQGKMEKQYLACPAQRGSAV